MALKVKIFHGDVETAFNTWSEKTSAQIATAQYVENEANVSLIVFYQEKPKPSSVLQAAGPVLVQP